MVLLALQAAEKVFGADTNSKGYKVPRGCGVIQGDGISIQVLEEILQTVMAHGYSAQVNAKLMRDGITFHFCSCDRTRARLKSCNMHSYPSNVVMSHDCNTMVMPQLQFDATSADCSDLCHEGASTALSWSVASQSGCLTCWYAPGLQLSLHA